MGVYTDAYARIHTHNTHMDRLRPTSDSGRLLPVVPKDPLTNALDAIVVSTDLIEDELRPHLETVLTVIQEKQRGAAEQVAVSGVLPTLAQALRRRGPLTLMTAKLVSELARETVIRERCGEAGVSSALLSVLVSRDQELLIHAGRAIARICYESRCQQEQLLRLGAVPRLVGILLGFKSNKALEGVCLVALCNLGDMGEGGEDGGISWERGLSLCPEESVFRGVTCHSCGFGSMVTVVRLTQWSPGQHTVSIEVLSRYSIGFWTMHNNRRTVRRSPLSHLGTCPRFYKAIKYSVQNIPNSRSLKSLIFHIFL
uniref:rap1 GTPase-GDP dissociation stimulator 1 isoform X1 n=1 Tax=Oncorhynchus gorbuscha TaxID=8017 RepID=UPI001EAED7C9|nr:rap1 GTPase-GDP dissociation stimulator 1 isoform X1 [Oncorhynchus gorbuscha]